MFQSVPVSLSTVVFSNIENLDRESKISLPRTALQILSNQALQIQFANPIIKTVSIKAIFKKTQFFLKKSSKLTVQDYILRNHYRRQFKLRS